MDQVGKLQTNAQVEQVAFDCLGPLAGVAQVCNTLKARGHPRLAKEVSQSHRVRNAAAHPRPSGLPERLRTALSDDNDPQARGHLTVPAALVLEDLPPAQSEAVFSDEQAAAEVPEETARGAKQQPVTLQV